MPEATLRPWEIQARQVEGAGFPEVAEKIRAAGREQDAAKQKGQSDAARGIFATARTDLLKRQEGDASTFRQGFKKNLKLGLGQQQQGLQQRFRQSAGRAGLANSGVEQAGLQTVAAAGQQQFAQSLGEFESKLAQLQASERGQLDQGELDFISSLYKMGVQHDMDLEMVEFQAQLEADKQSASYFGDILNAGVQITLDYYTGGGYSAVKGASGNQPLLPIFS